MVEAICYFRRERTRTFHLFGNNGTRARHHKNTRRRRYGSIAPGLDLRECFPTLCRTDQRFARLCGLLYPILAFPDVATLAAADIYKGLESPANFSLLD